jgi:hypothetical protein
MNESEIIEHNKNVVLRYLESVNKMLGNSKESYILANGTLFIGREPSKNFIKTTFEPEMNRCYYNAQNISFEYKNLRYFEGVAFYDCIGLPIDHAWCVSDGKVIDITWEKPFEKYSRTCIYYGIDIPKGFVKKSLYERGQGVGAYVIGYYLLSLGYFRPV